MGYRLNNFTLIDQTTAPDPLAPNDFNNWANNCGEACDSMILDWSQNKLIEPNVIKDAILGPWGNGYSYVNQLSDYLNSQGIKTTWEEVLDPDVARAHIRQTLAQGSPVITLLFSDRVRRTGGHFTVSVGEDDSGNTVIANPWGGFFETLTLAQFRQAYNYYLIHAYCHEYKRGVTPTLNSTQWLKSRPTDESPAVPGAKVPKGAKIAVINWTVHNKEGLWQRVQWRDKQGWVRSRYVVK